MYDFALTDHVVVITETAPPCRAGRVSAVFTNADDPRRAGPPRVTGYTVVPDDESPGHRGYNWEPREIVSFAVFEQTCKDYEETDTRPDVVTEYALKELRRKVWA